MVTFPRLTWDAVSWDEPPELTRFLEGSAVASRSGTRTVGPTPTAPIVPDPRAGNRADAANPLTAGAAQLARDHPERLRRPRCTNGAPASKLRPVRSSCCRSPNRWPATRSGCTARPPGPWPSPWPEPAAVGVVGNADTALDGGPGCRRGARRDGPRRTGSRSATCRRPCWWPTRLPRSVSGSDGDAGAGVGSAAGGTPRTCRSSRCPDLERAEDARPRAPCPRAMPSSGPHALQPG